MKTIEEKNILLAEFMGQVLTINDYTEYNEDGSIKFTPHEDGTKWLVESWSRPAFYDDRLYRIYGSMAYNTLSDMQYHTSWEWLMPVVEKIERFETEDYLEQAANASVGDEFNPNEWYCSSFCINTDHVIITCHSVVPPDKQRNYIQFAERTQKGKASKLELTYESVVKFIEWYNENK